MQRPTAPTGVHANAAYFTIYVLAVPALLAILAIVIQRSGLDIAVSSQFYDAASHSFPLGALPSLDSIGHKALLALPIGIAMATLASMLLVWRKPALRAWVLPCAALLVALAAVPVLVVGLKNLTALPRPFKLAMFGGSLPMPEHWFAPHSPGGALPSNHAAAGYSVALLYFFGWAIGKPWLRWGGLALGIMSGLLFSLVRIMQGAHFLSQTVWSAALVCLVGALIFMPLLRPRGAHRAVAA